MSIVGHCSHLGIRSLLEFESARLGVPLRVRQQNLEWDPLAPAERIDVLVHQGGARPVDFGLWVDGEVTRLSTPLWLPDNTVPLYGPIDPDGVVQPLLSRHGYQVAIHLDPHALNGRAVRVLGPALEQALKEAKDALEDQVLRHQADRYVEVRLREVNQRLETRRNEERETFIALQRAEEDVRSQYRRLAEVRQDIDLLESHTLSAWKRAASRDIEKLRGMVPRAIQRIRMDDQKLAVTTNPVTVEYDDYDYELGRFEIRIDIPGRQLRVHGLDQEVGGYSHPHISTDGMCCLGNYGSLIADCLAQQDHLGLVVGMLEFLASYNPSSPYQDLRRWDPDWSDDDKWDSCYEDSGPRECVTCGEDGCPHHDDASDRCWEISDYTTCIECRDCDWASVAQDRCRDDHTAQECVECGTEQCAYANDADACFEAHEGEECPDCDNNNCQHHPGDGEEESE